MIQVISEGDVLARVNQKRGVDFLKRRCLLDFWGDWCVGVWVCVGVIRDRPDKIYVGIVYDGS